MHSPDQFQPTQDDAVAAASVPLMAGIHADDNEDSREKVELCEAVIDRATALRELLRIISGTLPLQLIKGAVPFSYSAILSRISAEVRSSATLINTLEDFTSIIFNSPLFYVQTFLGRLNTPEKRTTFGEAAQVATLFSLIVAAPQFGILSGSQNMLKLSGQDATVVQITGRFFDVYRYSVFLLSIQSVFDQLAIAAGRLYLPVGVQGASFALSTLFAYAAANGKWSLPQMGLQGVAWASLLRCAINVGLYSSSFCFLNKKNEKFKELALFGRTTRSYAKYFKELLLNGLPMLVMFGSELGSVYTLNILVGQLGRVALQAQLVVSQYQDLLLVPGSAIGSASQQLIANKSKQYGAKTKIYGNVAIGLGLVVPLMYMLLSLADPQLLISAFLDVNDPENSEVVSILDSNYLMAVSATNSILTALRLEVSQALMGAGKIGPSLTIGMLSSWLGVLCSWFLREAGFGVRGMNFGLTIGLGISAVILLAIWGRTDLSPATLTEVEVPEISSQQSSGLVFASQGGSVNGTPALEL